MATANVNIALGRMVATPAALDLLEDHEVSPLALCLKHAQGDWGELDAGDAALQLRELADDTWQRIMSVHRVGESTVWIITDRYQEVEPDRIGPATTILLPSEY